MRALGALAIALLAIEQELGGRARRESPFARSVRAQQPSENARRRDFLVAGGLLAD